MADTYYRIAQEALNNVLKHARASTVKLSLSHEEGLLRLRIVDNGCGFDLESAWKGGGMGLRSMSERCAELGARCAVVTRPGEGTTISVEMES